MIRAANTWREPNDAGRTAPRRANGNQCIAAHADYRRDDFVFPRTQSLAMRETEWGDRIKPIRPRVPNFVANIAFAILA